MALRAVEMKRGERATATASEGEREEDAGLARERERERERERARAREGEGEGEAWLALERLVPRAPPSCLAWRARHEALKTF